MLGKVRLIEEIIVKIRWIGIEVRFSFGGLNW